MNLFGELQAIFRTLAGARRTSMTSRGVFQSADAVGMIGGGTMAAWQR
jgi:hypothetical protein